MSPIKSLTVSIAYGSGKTAKAKTVTHVTIRIGSLVVGQATLGGYYTQEQALAEFNRNRSRFKMGDGYNGAKALGLVA